MIDHFLFVHLQRGFVENQRILLSLHFQCTAHAEVLLNLHGEARPYVMSGALRTPRTAVWKEDEPEFYQGQVNHETFAEWQIDVLECEGHLPLFSWSEPVRTVP